MIYNGKNYEAVHESSDFSCLGCSFEYRCKKMTNAGLKTKPEYKEVLTGKKGCSSPNIEPFRSCKRDHVIYKLKV